MKWIQLPLLTLLLILATMFRDVSVHRSSRAFNQESEWLVVFDSPVHLNTLSFDSEIHVVSRHVPLSAAVFSTKKSDTEFTTFINAIPGVKRCIKALRDQQNSPVYPTGLALLVPSFPNSFKLIQETLQTQALQTLDALGWIVVEIPVNESFEQFKNKCLKTGLIREVHRDEIIECASHQTNDPMYSGSWHIQQANDIDIDASQAWSLIPTSAATRSIAIIEGVGFDTLNTDLTGRFIDKFNAVDNSTNVYSNTTNERHGTATCGIPGAICNNAVSAAGLGYNKLKLQLIRIGYNITTSGNFSTTSTIQAAAVNRAMAIGSTVAISMSFGTSTLQTAVQSAITSARQQGRGNKGIPVFASTGNSGLSTWTNYPASYSGVIAVGATTSADARASFSNYGTGITLSAPGSSIATTDITGAQGYGTGDNTYFSGTSAACPVAATVGALMIVVNDNLTETQVKQYLAQSCEKVGGYSYTANSTYTLSTWSTALGYGRVNMQAALQLALPQAPSLPDITISGASVSSTSPQVGQSITINANQQVTPSNGGSISPVLEYRYSIDNVWSTDDVVIGTDVSMLGAGISSESENITYTIPAGSGTRYILVRADAQNTVSELNENNNTGSISISIPAPSTVSDVTVINATVSSPSVIAGQTITISCTQRISSASTTVFPTIQYRLSTDMTWQSTDTYIGSDISTFSSSVQNENENITYVIPNTPGTRYILIKGDAGNAIAESNEYNNVTVIPIVIAAAMQVNDDSDFASSKIRIENSSVEIYPNPSSGILHAYANEFEWNSLRVLASTGEEVKLLHRTPLQLVEIIDLHELPAGNYLLQFCNSETCITRRFVLE
jgi:Subtilase family/CARDB